MTYGQNQMTSNGIIGCLTVAMMGFDEVSIEWVVVSSWVRMDWKHLH